MAISFSGGNGGSIYLVADPQIHSLEDYRNRRIIKAQNGASGAGNDCKGKKGEAADHEKAVSKSGDKEDRKG